MKDSAKIMKENASKMRVFVWDTQKKSVAEAIAKGDHSVKEILAEFKITEAMFYRWKNKPEFRAKMDEHSHTHFRFFKS
jgi:transposase